MKTGAIILAGGNSARMHFPKPFLNFDGRCFLEKIIDAYRSADFNEIAVVINDRFTTGEWTSYLSRIRLKSLIVQNGQPGRGRFYSLKLGAEALKEVDYCFVQNVDNPFVEASLLKRLWAHKNEAGYVLPVRKNRGGHPVLINREILTAIRTGKDDSLILRDFLQGYNKKELVVRRESVLVNMNDQREYYREMVKFGVLQYLR